MSVHSHLYMYTCLETASQSVVREDTTSALKRKAPSLGSFADFMACGKVAPVMPQAPVAPQMSEVEKYLALPDEVPGIDVLAWWAE